MSGLRGLASHLISMEFKLTLCSTSPQRTKYDIKNIFFFVEMEFYVLIIVFDLS